MKAEELREKDDRALEQLEEQLRGELFRLRLKFRTGQTQKTSELRQTRRDIARIKTILRERATD